ncbi:hypothetical protein D9M72_570490 [compost metagenome]
MVGLVDRLDPRQRVFHRETSAVDLHVLGDQPRYRAEAAGDAHRADIGVRRQRAVEHARVKLIGLTVDVEEGAREMRQQHRRSEKSRVLKQLIDIVVFRPANRNSVEPRLIEKALGIGPTAMR